MNFVINFYMEYEYLREFQNCILEEFNKNLQKVLVEFLEGIKNPKRSSWWHLIRISWKNSGKIAWMNR